MQFLGWVTGASGSSSNSFQVPRGARYLYLNANATGLLYQMGLSTGPTGVFAASPTMAIPLPYGALSQALRQQRLDPPAVTMVAIYSPAGTAVSVAVYCELDT